MKKIREQTSGHFLARQSPGSHVDSRYLLLQRVTDVAYERLAQRFDDVIHIFTLLAVDFEDRSILRHQGSPNELPDILEVNLPIDRDFFLTEGERHL